MAELSLSCVTVYQEFIVLLVTNPVCCMLQGIIAEFHFTCFIYAPASLSSLRLHKERHSSPLYLRLVKGLGNWMNEILLERHLAQQNISIVPVQVSPAPAPVALDVFEL